MSQPRSTRQRTMIRKALGENREFQTAQELHAHLERGGAKIGLATVYRGLGLMYESGEVDQIVTADNETAYRRCSDGHHHHLVCRNCRTAVEVDGPPVEAWSQQMGEQHGFSDMTHTVELFGICQECAQAQVQPDPDPG
ncbi:transcriptional repressor [Candidatus Nanopelagicales bacterium]|nr:transcriptional repressor [Candidatus Nanopelagicales bacterium]